MAVVFEGFSIREYASKMRSVDIGKCWPFASDVTPEAVDTLLPPITITKFRWWSHELHLLRSNTTQHPSVSDTKPRENDEKMVDMVCQVDAHGDERRRVKMAAKAKCRAPKKRSIVEIFAVAPQIHNLVVDDDLEEDSGEEEEEEEETPEAGDGSIGVLTLKSNVNKKKKKAKKNLKIKKVVVDKLMMKKKMKRQKRLKKKTNCKERPTLKKDITCRLKKQNQVNFSKKTNGSAHARQIVEGIFSAVANNQKTALPCLATQKNKEVESSKVLKPELPVHSILKSKRKVSAGENAATCNMQTVSMVKSFSIQKSDKHVRFSDQNGMLGTRKKPISSEHGVCNLHSDALAPLSRKDQFTHSDKNLVTIIESESDHDDNYIGPENESKVQTMTGKEKLPDAGDHFEIPYFVRTHFSCQEQRGHILNKSVPPSQVVMCNYNLDMADHSNGAASCNDSYAVNPRHLSTTKGVRSPPVNSQIFGHVSQSSSSSGKSIDCFDDGTHRVPAISSKENTWPFRQLTSSGFACSGIPNRDPHLSKSATENISTTQMQHEPFCCQSSMELMGSLFPFPEWKERAVTFREKNMEEGFLGLPLNSQGELVQTNSFLVRGFNQLEYSGLTTGSSSSLTGCGSLLPSSVEDFSNSKGKHFVERAVPEDQLNLFPVHTCRKEKPTVYLPARLGVNEGLTEKAGANLLNYETRNNNFSCSLDPKPRQMNNSFNAVRQHDQVQHQNGNGIIQSRENSDYMFLNNSQPTMRLMGKDVAVGRCNAETKQCDGRKVITDNEILAGHQPINSATDNSSLKVHFLQDWFLHPVLEKSKENPTHEAVQSNTFIEAAEAKIPKFLSSHPKWQTLAVFQNGSPIDSVNPGSRFHLVGPSFTSPAILKRVLEPVAYGAETLRNSSQQPMLSATQNVRHHMNYSPAELKYKQNRSHVTKSPFSFPFLHPDSSEHVQPLLLQSSSNSLIPWLLHATQQVKTNTSPQPFLEAVGKDHPQTTRVNFLTTPSTHHSPVISYPPNSTTSPSYMEGPLGPASTNHSPHLSAPVGIKPNCSASWSNRNRKKVRNRMKSKGFGVKCMDRYHKASKRPATTEDNSSKPTKIPHLGLEDDLGSATGLGIQIHSSNMQYDARKIESGSNKRSSEQSIQTQFQNNELSTSREVELSKVDGIRYGPIKLSAGAKHILKPSLNTDQDNSRLVHSTIPCISMMDCGGFMETQKKPTKISRL